MRIGKSFSDVLPSLTSELFPPPRGCPGSSVFHFVFREGFLTNYDLCFVDPVKSTHTTSAKGLSPFHFVYPVNPTFCSGYLSWGNNNLEKGQFKPIVILYVSRRIGGITAKLEWSPNVYLHFLEVFLYLWDVKLGRDNCACTIIRGRQPTEQRFIVPYSGDSDVAL